MKTCADLLWRLLLDYGVDTVFGIPGIHTVELYRNFPPDMMRHITPRHEQGAGMMAHGYAMATGKPGVCFLITGPGLLNAATAIGQAYSDSIPMLVICAVNRRDELGMGGGRLHEVSSQRDAIEPVTAFTHTLLDADNLPEVVARAFSVFGSRRPRPVCIEIPIDVLAEEITVEHVSAPTIRPPAPNPQSITDAVDALRIAERPVIILGGGAAGASKEAQALAERLDAPVVLTTAGKGVVNEAHPLCLGYALQFKAARDMIAQADVTLAVGTELAETDLFFARRYEFSGQLIRVDICPEQLNRNYVANISILGDAKLALSAILDGLSEQQGADKGGAGKARVAEARDAMSTEWPRLFSDAAAKMRVLDVIRSVLPADGVIAADSTQLAYLGCPYFPCPQPRSWLYPAGFGTLGTGLPNAIGFKLGAPDRPVVCIAGDGGFLFTIQELATAAENKLSLPIIIWNNGGYKEIKEAMVNEKVVPIGVDLFTPDFVAIAKGFGCAGEKIDAPKKLRDELESALSRDGPTLLELSAKAFV